MDVDLFLNKGRVFPDNKSELSWVIESIKKGNQEVPLIYFESDDPLLKEVGFHSVKVVAPGLFPLYYNEHNVPLAHPRLKGSMLGPVGADSTHSFPHPFP